MYDWPIAGLYDLYAIPCEHVTSWSQIAVASFDYSETKEKNI